MKNRINVSIANLPFSILIDDLHLYLKLKYFFSSYISKKSPQFQIYISNLYTEHENFDNEKRYPIEIIEINSRLLIVEKSPQLKKLGAIYKENKTCILKLNHDFHFSYVISSIRTCFMYYLELSGGFILHASSGIISDKAHIFTGRCNAGKSTALRNLNSDKVIADDTVAISTKGRTAHVWATPFRKDKKSSAKISAIYFPKKSKVKLEIKEASLLKAIKTVISNIHLSAPLIHNQVNEVLTNVEKFCLNTPSFDLYSQKQSNLRKVIL